MPNIPMPRLSAFESQVVKAISHLHPNGYGVPIRDHVEVQTGKAVSLGAIYAALERLEDNGLIVRRDGEATAERGWRKKSYFTLTLFGIFNWIVILLTENAHLFRDMGNIHLPTPPPT